VRVARRPRRVRVAAGRSAVVLSEVREIDEDGLGVVVLVTDRRDGSWDRRYYSVRLQCGALGWEVVQLRRMG